MRQLKTFVIILFCALSINFFFSPVGQAKAFQAEVTLSQSYYFMGFFDRFKASNKKVEGQAQESKGKLTNDQGEQLKGKAKQAQGKMMETTEDVEDAAKKTSKNVEKAVNKASENLSDSFNELGKNLQNAMEAK